MANVTWMIPGYIPELINYCLSEDLDYYRNRIMRAMGVSREVLEGIPQGALQMFIGQPMRPSSMILPRELYNDIVAMSAEERSAWFGQNEVYVQGEPQYVGRIPDRQELSVQSNPAGELPLRGFTSNSHVVDDGFVSRSVSTFSELNPEEPLEVYHPSARPLRGVMNHRATLDDVNLRELDPDYSFLVPAGSEEGYVREPQPWSRDYKKQNQHLFRKRK